MSFFGVIKHTVIEQASDGISVTTTGFDHGQHRHMSLLVVVLQGMVAKIWLVVWPGPVVSGRCGCVLPAAADGDPVSVDWCLAWACCVWPVRVCVTGRC